MRGIKSVPRPQDRYERIRKLVQRGRIQNLGRESVDELMKLIFRESNSQFSRIIGLS